MRPVLICSSDPGWTDELAGIADAAAAVAADVTGALALARRIGPVAPATDGGSARRWELLATVAAADLTVARVLEPHLDAIEIRQQAGLPAGTEHTWGVFAAEAPGLQVTAVEQHGVWRLDGVKPWCSLAGRLDRALITARTASGARRLFECSLRDEGVSVATGGWAARGLSGVASERIELDGVAAEPVGDEEWYLRRDGFAWGGIGVAAVWFGASVAIGRALVERQREREADQIAQLHVGETDALLSSCAAVLAAASRDVDAARRGATPIAPAVLAQRVRSTVSAGAERIIAISGHASGPAPLALDEEHARRIADLALYVRQDHAERDLARLGAKLLAAAETPW